MASYNKNRVTHSLMRMRSTSDNTWEAKQMQRKRTLENNPNKQKDASKAQIKVRNPNSKRVFEQQRQQHQGYFTFNLVILLVFRFLQFFLITVKDTPNRKSNLNK